MTEFEKKVIELLEKIDKKITAQVVVTPVQLGNDYPIKELIGNKNPYEVKF